MPTARNNGVDIYYEDSSGPGPALLFSHGFLMDREMFAPQIEALRGRYRCITWDERGFGKTGPVDQPFSYWDSGRDALGLLAHLNITAATLIGMSQGGFLSMRAALLEPERVKALVLISTRSGLDAPEIVANFHQLRAEWLANGCANVKGMLGDLLLGKERADPQPWFAKWEKMTKQSLAYPIDALAGRDDLTPRIKDLRCPAIVFHGEADIAIDATHGAALAKALPNCKAFIRVPGAGHTPNLTHPDLVNPPLIDFLAKWA